MDKLNHYEALGVAQTATSSDIRAAYKELALKFHPVSIPSNFIIIDHDT